MAAFTPNVGVLPGHTAEPTYQELLPYATLLEEQGARAFVPELPDELTRNRTTAFWAEPSGFPVSGNDRKGQDKLRESLAHAGVNALLIVNTADQRLGWIDEPGVIHHSISDVISASAMWARVPLAQTHAHEHEGGDTHHYDLWRRAYAIKQMGATIVGADLAGMPVFLSENTRPDLFVTPYRKARHE